MLPPWLSCLTLIRTFKFDIFISEDSNPPVQLPSALADTFARLPNLEKLVLRIPDRHIDVFEKKLIDARFPNVRTLVVGPFCEFAVRLCPNLTTLSSNGWAWSMTERRSENVSHTERLIMAAASAEKLVNLNIDQQLEPEQLAYVFDRMPQLTHLGTIGGGFRGSFWAKLPTLSRFERLTHLYLCEASSLGVGFDGGPRCGNAYMGPKGAELLRRVQAQRHEAEAKVADAVVPKLRSLEELWIGDHTEVQVLRNGDGTVNQTIFDRTKRVDKVVQYPQP